jgi:hypothetical protein
LEKSLAQYLTPLKQLRPAAATPDKWFTLEQNGKVFRSVLRELGVYLE